MLSSSRNSDADARALKARFVFPVSDVPIPNGLVTIEGERIVSVGCDTRADQVRDLGNVAIIPGLINAHTHLEFSDLTEPLGEPGMGFTNWIGQVIRFRQTVAGTFRQPVEDGLRQCAALGTTALGEIAQPGWPKEAFDSAGLTAVVFQELIAPTTDRVGPALELARRHLATTAGCWHPGLSPHAPYSVRPELLRQSIGLSSARRIPIAFHLAESRQEMELLHSGAGPFRELLDRLDAWDPDCFPPGGRPLDYLRLLADAHRSLIIHGNYLDQQEIRFLAEHADRMAVVYCPRTHAYFRHDRYPLEEMLAAGVTVALGTDSRASSGDLSMLAEVRQVAAEYPKIAPHTPLKLATLSAAEALGLDRQTGSLEVGKYADLAVVALPDREADDPHELLLKSDRPVVSVWCRGVELASELRRK